LVAEKAAKAMSSHWTRFNPLS